MLSFLKKRSKKAVSYLLSLIVIFTASTFMFSQKVEADAGDYQPVYNYTGGLQQWTVPATGTYTITAVGASGGNTIFQSPYGGLYPDNNGGKGALVRGTFTLAKGHVINIVAGAKGGDTYHYYGGTGTGGGGGTYVVDTTTNTILLVAGGGGGGGVGGAGGAGSVGAIGNGQGGNGGTGSTGWYSNPSGGGGGGGGYYSNGVQGYYQQYNYSTRRYDTYYSGGGGGAGYAQGSGGGGGAANGGYGGGGGGGAYGYFSAGASGGGGGYTGGTGGSCSGGGGGGGTSYNSGSSPVNNAGANVGNGYAVIDSSDRIGVVNFIRNYTGGLQQWTVPGNGTYTINAVGASGGNTIFQSPYGGLYSDNNGGKGALVRGTFTLTKGHVINIVAGAKGGDTYHYYGGTGTGGGGGTYVVDTTTNTILLVAGGGGGGGVGGAGGAGSVGAIGNGQGGNGGVGSTGWYSNPSGGGGGGGGYYSNGVQGYYQQYNYSTRRYDTYYSGGGGGAGYAQGSGGGGGAANGGYGGGGGGGAYGYFSAGASGGGGGYTGGTGGSCYGGGGGGGTSYNSGSSPVNNAGVNVGNGYMTVTGTYAVNDPPTAATITSYSDGQSLNTNMPTISWNFNDPNPGDTQGAYQVVGSNNGWASWTYNSGKINSSNRSITLPALSDGTWQFAVQTWDNGGAGPSPWAYRSNIKIDTTPPTVTFSPSGGKAYTTSTISITASDVLSSISIIYYKWDSNGYTSVSGGTAAVSPPSIGLHTLYAYAKDSVGNTSSPVSVSYSVVIPVVLNTPTLFGSGFYDENELLSATGANFANATYRIFYTTKPTAPAITVDPSTGNLTGTGWADSGVANTMTVNSSSYISEIIADADLNYTNWTYVTFKVWAASPSPWGDTAVKYTTAYSLKDNPSNADSFIGRVAHNQILSDGIVVANPNDVAGNVYIDGDYVKYRFEFDVLKASRLKDMNIALDCNLYNDPDIKLQLSKIVLEKGTENPPGSGQYTYSIIKDFSGIATDGPIGGTNRYSFHIGNDNGGTPMFIANGAGRYAIEYEGIINVRYDKTATSTVMRNDVQMDIYTGSEMYPDPVAKIRPNRKFYMDINISKLIVKYI